MCDVSDEAWKKDIGDLSLDLSSSNNGDGSRLDASTNTSRDANGSTHDDIATIGMDQSDAMLAALTHTPHAVKTDAPAPAPPVPTSLTAAHKKSSSPAAPPPPAPAAAAAAAAAAQTRNSARAAASRRLAQGQQLGQQQASQPASDAPVPHQQALLTGQAVAAAVAAAAHTTPCALSRASWVESMW